jgi:hypothetical protein
MHHDELDRSQRAYNSLEEKCTLLIEENEQLI